MCVSCFQADAWRIKVFLCPWSTQAERIYRSFLGRPRGMRVRGALHGGSSEPEWSSRPSTSGPKTMGWKLVE